jgi:hypothetical protein
LLLFLPTLLSSSASLNKRVRVILEPPSNLFKAIKELLPEIITHLGPKQLGALRDLTKGMGKKTDEIKEENEEDDEEIPKLVNQNFEKAEETK